MTQMIEIGSQAPTFELPDECGRLVSLTSHLQPNGVLVAFIHNTWCPECMHGVLSLRRTYWFVRQLRVNLLIVSRQSVASLASFLASFDREIPFPMLADEAGEVFTRYNLASEIDLHQVKASYFVDRWSIIRTINKGLKLGWLTPFGL